MEYNVKDFKKPNHSQRQIILRRQLDPKNYLVIKDTRSALLLWDTRTRKVRRIEKWQEKPLTHAVGGAHEDPDQ